MTRPLMWMKAVRDHPERPPAMQCHVLDRLALRMDWTTGCGSASGAQLAADADCDQRTVKRATSWARVAEMLVQTRRGHRIDAERAVASEWRLCVPAQQDTGVPLATDPRGQHTRPKGTGKPTQGDSTTPPSRPRSSRPRSSARGDGANAPRPPREPQTQHRDLVECADCRRPLRVTLITSPDDPRRAEELAEIFCDDCLEAGNQRYLSAASIEQLISDGSVAEAIKLGIRQAAEFPPDIIAGYVADGLLPSPNGTGNVIPLRGATS